MAVMARASRDDLARLWQAAGTGMAPETLLAPETGMVRLTTRAGHSGPCFQFGEATLTRAVVAWQGLRGYAVHLGSDGPKAQTAACLDLLVQTGCQEVLKGVQDMAAAQAAREAARTAQVEATKVRFYTTKTSG